jgi:hypothetical protein
MILEQQEQQEIVSLMDGYKKMHDEIVRVEVSIRDFEKSLKLLYEDKDKVVKGIEDNRKIEAEIIQKLITKYGEGKLDIRSFEWVNNKQE